MRETENPFDNDEEEVQSPKRGESSRSSNPPYEQNMKAVQSFSSQGHGRSSSGSGYFFGSSSKDKKKKDKDKKSKSRKPFNLEAEKDQMKATIAESSISATNLMNALKSINRETERISDNQSAVQGFNSCKQLRRKILRYVGVPTAMLAMSELLAMLTCNPPDPPRRERAIPRQLAPRQRRAHPSLDDV